VLLHVAVEGRIDDRIEVAAYYVVSEALTNAVKHANASRAEVTVESRHGGLELRIQDDGVGGAHAARGSGLTGLRDRVEAIGGAITLRSPPGEGTFLHVSFPTPAQSAPPGG
jgi:signal transduction histidine kinase